MMDTHEVERIRALVADEYATLLVMLDERPYDELMLADLRTLLAIVDAQAAVIAAAGEVVKATNDWMNSPYPNENTIPAGIALCIDDLEDALADARG